MPRALRALGLERDQRVPRARVAGPAGRVHPFQAVPGVGEPDQHGLPGAGPAHGERAPGAGRRRTGAPGRRVPRRRRAAARSPGPAGRAARPAAAVLAAPDAAPACGATSPGSSAGPTRNAAAGSGYRAGRAVSLAAGVRPWPRPKLRRGTGNSARRTLARTAGRRSAGTARQRRDREQHDQQPAAGGCRAGPRRGRPGPPTPPHPRRRRATPRRRAAAADGQGLRIRTRTPTSKPGSAAATWARRCRTSPRPAPPASREITTESMSPAWCTGVAAPNRAEYQASTRRRSPSRARRTTAATHVGGSPGPGAERPQRHLHPPRGLRRVGALLGVPARRGPPVHPQHPDHPGPGQVRDRLRRFGSRRDRLRQVQHRLVRPRVGGGQHVPGDAVASRRRSAAPPAAGPWRTRRTPAPGRSRCRLGHPVVGADQPPDARRPGERHGRRNMRSRAVSPAAAGDTRKWLDLTTKFAPLNIHTSGIEQTGDRRMDTPRSRSGPAATARRVVPAAGRRGAV